MTQRGLRIALAGASGALGSEVASVFGERRFPVSGLSAFATDRSLGGDIELGDEVVAIEAKAPRIAGHDLLILCTPRDVARELAREALLASVPVIDCSGAFATQDEVPLGVAEMAGVARAVAAPLVAIPPGPVLGWLPVLHALEQRAGLETVSATVLRSLSHAGGRGIDALSGQTIAALTHQDPPDSELFPESVAFDSVPALAGADIEVEEQLWAEVVQRVFEPAPRVVATAVQVPAFAADGTVLSLQTRDALSPADALEVLGKAPGIGVWEEDRPGPTTRDAAGCDHTWVARVRSDPTRERGLLMWLAADALRLVACNVVGLAEARLRLN